MRRLITVLLLPLVFSLSVSAAEPIRPLATGAGSITPTSLTASGESSFDAREAGARLPSIYAPYAPGQSIPAGWQLVTVRFPVRETRTKTVCEEQIVQVPKQVPCMLSKTIRFPTEVYKTYIKFKEIQVEDGVLQRHEDAPEADLDDLDLGDDEDDTVPVSLATAISAAGDGRDATTVLPTRDRPDSQHSFQKKRPAAPRISMGAGNEDT